MLAPIHFESSKFLILRLVGVHASLRNDLSRRSETVIPLKVRSGVVGTVQVVVVDGDTLVIGWRSGGRARGGRRRVLLSWRSRGDWGWSLVGAWCWGLVDWCGLRGRAGRGSDVGSRGLGAGGLDDSGGCPIVVAVVLSLGDRGCRLLASGDSHDVGHVDDVDVGDNITLVWDGKSASREGGKGQGSAHFRLLLSRGNVLEGLSLMYVLGSQIRR